MKRRTFKSFYNHFRDRQHDPYKPATRAERIALFRAMHKSLGFPLKISAWYRLVKNHPIQHDFAFIQGNMETAVRETLLDLVPWRVVHRHWPTWGERTTQVAFDKWHRGLFEACVRKGLVPRGGKFTPEEPMRNPPRRRSPGRRYRRKNPVILSATTTFDGVRFNDRA